MSSKPKLKIEFKFPKWFEAISAHEDQLLDEVAATILTNRAQMFDAGGASNGHQAWEPLKLRKGVPLSDTGTLRRSLSPGGANGKPGPGGVVKKTRDIVSISTTIAYAAIQNQGGIIRPTQKSVLSWKVGKRRYFAKKVEIPARPFLGNKSWNQQDQDEVNQVLSAKIARILNEAGL